MDDGDSTTTRNRSNSDISSDVEAPNFSPYSYYGSPIPKAPAAPPPPPAPPAPPSLRRSIRSSDDGDDQAKFLKELFDSNQKNNKVAIVSLYLRKITLNINRLNLQSKDIK